MHTRGLATEHGAVGRLHTPDRNLPELLPEHASHTADGSACPDTRDEAGELPADLLQDLERRPFGMTLRVRHVFELAGHEGSVGVAQDLRRLAHRTGHALGRRREHDLSTISAQDVTPLEAHVLRHHEDTTVA